jgi:hypothetical protein
VSREQRIAKFAADAGISIEQAEEQWAASEAKAADQHAHRRLDPAALIARHDRDVPWRCRPLLCDGHLTVLAGWGGEARACWRSRSPEACSPRSQSGASPAGKGERRSSTRSRAAAG